MAINLELIKKIKRKDTEKSGGGHVWWFVYKSKRTSSKLLLLSLIVSLWIFIERERNQENGDPPVTTTTTRRMMLLYQFLFQRTQMSHWSKGEPQIVIFEQLNNNTTHCHSPLHTHTKRKREDTTITSKKRKERIKFSNWKWIGEEELKEEEVVVVETTGRCGVERATSRTRTSDWVLYSRAFWAGGRPCCCWWSKAQTRNARLSSRHDHLSLARRPFLLLLFYLERIKLVSAGGRERPISSHSSSLQPFIDTGKNVSFFPSFSTPLKDASERPPSCASSLCDQDDDDGGRAVPCSAVPLSSDGSCRLSIDIDRSHHVERDRKVFFFFFFPPTSFLYSIVVES